MTLFITVLHVLVCIFLIVVVLLQRGKGAEVGAMFGGGGSGTMFGARGAGNLLTRLTTISATVFMLTSLYLAYLGREASSSDLFDEPIPAESGFEEAMPETSPFESVGEAAPSAGGFEEVTPETAPDPGGSEPAGAAVDAPAAGDPAPAEAPRAQE